MTPVSPEGTITLALVVLDTLTVAGANIGMVGCDTEAMRDGAIGAHPSIIALTLVNANAQTVTRAHRCIIGCNVKASQERAIIAHPPIAGTGAVVWSDARTVTITDAVIDTLHAITLDI